jgi:uncharacterized protein (TIGR01244 family)
MNMLPAASLTPDYAVAPQLTIEAMAEAASAGFTHVICNRPDDEDHGQPSAARMQAACTAAGLGFAHIPMAGGLSLEMIEQTRAIMAQGGKVLAYCRSGNRSTLIWGCARAAAGDAPEDLARLAAGCGQNLAPVMQIMRQLYAQGAGGASAS